MKVFQFRPHNYPYQENRVGLLFKHKLVCDITQAWERIYQKENRYRPELRAQQQCPPSLSKIIQFKDAPLDFLQETFEKAQALHHAGDLAFLNLDQVELIKPLNDIPTYRDFYTHEGHVKKGFEKRGEEMPEEWYQMPVYYKGSSKNFIGPNEEIPWPSFTQKLDYELELAAIMARDGRSIKKKDALKHVFGWTVLNDVSARDIQKKEMRARLGPSKGKDFCSAIGPIIVTADEFNFREPNFLMTARVNGEEWSRGQSGEAQFNFSQMIEFCSQEEWLCAGDLLGSGTVSTGCGLELDRWIQPGDLIELEIEGIGVLSNKIGRPQGK